MSFTVKKNNANVKTVLNRINFINVKFYKFWGKCGLFSLDSLKYIFLKNIKWITNIIKQKLGTIQPSTVCPSITVSFFIKYGIYPD